MYDYAPILERLKAAKKKSNLTNEELSNASGVPLGTVNKILSGATTEPKLPAFMALASVLGTSVDFLVYGVSAPPYNLNPEEENLIANYRNATVESRQNASLILSASAQIELKKKGEGAASAG